MLLLIVFCVQLLKMTVAFLTSEEVLLIPVSVVFSQVYTDLQLVQVAVAFQKNK